MLFKTICLLALATPLLAFSVIYTDCQGESLLSYCQTTLETGFSSTENNKFHHASGAHEYYTVGLCKITFWTSGPRLQFDDTLGFTRALTQIDRTCRDKKSKSDNGNLFSGVFVGYLDPYPQTPVVIQVNGS
ncbi:uncharacterized protein MELLADRAFT_104799 [Melampsora larici-populina 98AG31]|uniref:Secreted protein n=1 Tax=Melampsora larici-populina (strain 98AG31 / pathotype 3-4-7) TaxID=747676 RepID=F4RG79_MELLP|nr:uncharacterized protein MELLADRAFT_104799 [Melampsora larici-populina 98AG31]EGG08430.1 secreted protein [Melampsora larici-populina 98AG31]